MQHVLLIAWQSTNTISRNITRVSWALLFNPRQSQNVIIVIGSVVFISDRFELKDFWSPGSTYVFVHENNIVILFSYRVLDLGLM